ncbi:MAG: hypothetical protein ACLGPL_07805 [Acidobacteriota bacterium]
MNDFGPFRLIDRIVEYRRGEHIATVTDLAARNVLTRTYSTESLLVEIAAQTCGLMNRLALEDAKDCFLGKVKSMSFHTIPEALSKVLATARPVMESKGLTLYEGNLAEHDSGKMLAEFEILICTTESLDVKTDDERSEYWRRYLNRLTSEFESRQGMRL